MKQKLKMWRIASLLFILSTFIELGRGILIIKPSSTEALIGQTAYFNCSSSIQSAESEIQWFYYPVQEKSQRQLVYGYGRITEPRFSGFQMEMNNATGAFNLVIRSVVLDNAGKYECQEEFGRGEKSNAELIVLESLPVCASATDLTQVIGANNCGIKSDQLLLSCIVQYRGNEPPVMKWRKSGEQTTIDSQIAPTKLNNKIIYNITMDGASVVNGSAFECFATRAAASIKCHTENVNVISKRVSYDDDEDKRPDDEDKRPDDEDKRPDDEDKRPDDEDKRPDDEDKRPIGYDYRTIFLISTVGLLSTILLSIMIIFLISKRKHRTDSINLI